MLFMIKTLIVIHNSTIDNRILIEDRVIHFDSENGIEFPPRVSHSMENFGITVAKLDPMLFGSLPPKGVHPTMHHRELYLHLKSLDFICKSNRKLLLLSV